jgi:hypothetical protein
MTSRLEMDRSQEFTRQDPGIDSMFSERESERYVQHSRHMNEMMVRVLKTIGYDVGFCRGAGQYLFDRAGVRYLDLLSGWGVFGIGRNHPKLRDTLSSVLASDFPNLVQMDVSPLAYRASASSSASRWMCCASQNQRNAYRRVNDTPISMPCDVCIMYHIIRYSIPALIPQLSVPGRRS